MNIVLINKLSNDEIERFANIIYKNFIELASIPELKHNVQEISNIFKEKTFYGLMLMKDNKIIGYIIGKNIDLDDGRNIYYVDYIYINKANRDYGYGTKLMDMVEQKALKERLKGVMLICDTDNKLVYNFYTRRGYLPDSVLRRYGQHEVMFKPTYPFQFSKLF